MTQTPADLVLYGRSSCSKCSLCKHATTVCVPGRGDPQADIMLVGEAPGYNEDIEGRPFIGKAGDMLSGILERVGIDEGKVWITNIVKCRPPDNRDPTDLEVIECSEYLRNEIQHIRPKVIVAMGKPASRVLLGDSSKTGIGKLRGNPKVQDFADYFGLEGDLTIPVMPTWHPAYALRTSSAVVEIETDLTIAKQLLAGSSQPKANYQLIDDPAELMKWTDAMLALYRAGRIEYLACDIETDDEVTDGEFNPKPYSPDTNIVSIQFCWAPGKAVLIPVIRRESCFNNTTHIQTLRSCVKKLFEEVPIVGQNFKFDAIYFWCKLGLKVKKFIFDTLLSHHFLHGGLLANDLDFLAARYLGRMAHKGMIQPYLDKLEGRERNYGNLPTDVLVEYGCADTDKTFCLVPILRGMLEEQDYSVYAADVFYPNMLVAFEATMMFPWRQILGMELLGAATDQDRFPEVAAQLKADMETTLTKIHGSKFHRPWREATKEKNKKRVKAKKKCKYRLLCGKCGHELYIDPPKPKDYGCPKCNAGADEIQLNRKMVPTGEFITDPEQPEWIYKDLNPRSPKQVAFLLYEIMNLPTQMNKGKVTTDKEARASLITYCMEEELEDRADVIDALGSFNAVSKLHSNYGEGLQQFFFVKTPADEKSSAATAQFEPPTGVGFLHTHYFQDGTRSGRLSTRKPPLHTIPKKSVIKELFPSRYKGGLILQADYSQAEVRAFVIETGDPDLRQAFRDGIDPHTLTASKAFMVPLESVNGSMRDDSKAITFGILFGRGEAAIAKQTGKTVEEMRKVKRDFLDSMPKVKAWIKHQHNFVDLHKCVLSRLGRRRFLYDDLNSGDNLRINHAHNVAVNHPIQGLVGDICTTSAARLAYRLEDENFISVVFLTVHDAALLDVDPHEILVIPGVVREEMYEKLPKVFPFINVPMNLDIQVGVTWGHPMKLEVPETDLIVLKGPLQYLSGLHEQLAKSWRISMENLLRSEDEDGRPVVEAALRLQIG